MATLLAAFCYFARLAKAARHDALYTALLVAVWGFYFGSDRLLRTRLGSRLRLASRFVLLAGVPSFFGFVLWLIQTHP